MNYYIFISQQAAKDYDTQVCEKHNYSPGVNWAKPVKHPTEDKWRIAASRKVVLEDKEAVELTPDWSSN